jgi:hypothetical protein
LNCFFILGNNSGGGPDGAREGPGVDRGNGRKAGVGGGLAGRLQGFDWKNKALEGQVFVARRG